MTSHPADALSFTIICPETEDFIDIEFSGTTPISSLIDHLKTLLHLGGTDYYLSDGQTLDSRQSLKNILREGARYLLLNSKDSQSLLDRNLQLALKDHPEGFAVVPKKILVDVCLNGRKMKGFLDSGAVRSILSPEAVAKCGLQLLVDYRFRDEAAGIGGSQNATGKVHHCPLIVAGRLKPINFSVLKPGCLFDSEEALLGMDFIQKYVKSIDIEGGKVHFKDGSEAPATN